VSKPRTGTVDPFTRSDGSVYYRGKIRLGDGTVHRVTIDGLCPVIASPG
jgi:hypothetical protein